MDGGLVSAQNRPHKVLVWIGIKGQIRAFPRFL